MTVLIQAVFWCYCHRNLNLKKVGVNLMTSESDNNTKGTLEKVDTVTEETSEK